MALNIGDKMDDEEFQAVVRNEVENALGYYDSEFSEDRIKALNYYLGEPLGNEVEGRSQVVATEVSDTIEYIMPSLMKMFTQTDEYCRFMPRGPEDVQLAEQASDYVNYIINQDNSGFCILHNWFKDGLINKLGVVKAYWDDKTDVSTEEYEGLFEDELVQLLQDDEVEVVEQDARPLDGMDMQMDPRTGQMIPPPMVYDVTLKRTSEQGKVVVENIPPEEFLVNKRARSPEDAYMMAHRTAVPASDLIARGYPKDEVQERSGYTGLEYLEEKQSRFEDLESNADYSHADPAMQDVLVTECYIRSDYDNDDIAELRRVVMLGEDYHIVENEPFDHMPFAVISPILMPHRLIGRSVAELVMDLQKIKSTVWRQLLDNMYFTNNARMEAVEGQVNLDDLMTNRPGGIVRTKAPGMVNALTPPSIQKDSFPMLQYLDEVKAQRTGFSRQSMGMDADRLQSTTKAAIDMSMQNAQSKVEMIARVYAETGVKRLFSLILMLVNKHQSRERMIRLRGEFVPMDPRQWKNQYDVQINVGLGNGREEEKMAMLQAIRQDQWQVISTVGPNNPVVSFPQYAATGRRMAQLVGFKNTDEFYNDPRQAAQMEQQQAQNPQPSPEMLEHQRKMEELQYEQQRKMQEMQADLQRKQQEMVANLQLKAQEMQAEIQLERQKAAGQANIDVSKATNEIALDWEELQQETRLEEAKMKAETRDGQGNIPRNDS